MTAEGALLVFVLSLLAIVFAVLAVETRSLVNATYWYVAHSCCLILIYVTYAVFAGNHYLFVWAGLCGVNTWILPFLVGGLRYTAKRIPGESAADAPADVLSSSRAWPASAAPRRRRSTPDARGLRAARIDNLDQKVSLNLLAALLLFVYGIIVLLTQPAPLQARRWACSIMTAGAHLTLVQMAPRFFTMVEIEILTKVMGTVFAMLYAARLLAERFHHRCRAAAGRAR